MKARPCLASPVSSHGDPDRRRDGEDHEIWRRGFTQRREGIRVVARSAASGSDVEELI